MRKIFVIILILCLLLNGLVIQALAKNPTTINGNPQVFGAAAILMDAQSGQILYERNPNDRLAIASITKIMTAIVAVEKGNLDSIVNIGPEVLDRKKIYGTLLFLEPGEKFPLRDLIYALLLYSANDAAVAIANYIGVDEKTFVQMMNQQAENLGLKDTHFVNPHGLSEIGHFSSAYDMAVITQYALRNPVLAEISGTKQREFPRTKELLPQHLQNHNKLLWKYEGADGVKTGYTDLAGNTIVASATRNGRQLIAVILKETNVNMIYKDAGSLLDYGFSQFHNKLLASKNQVLVTENLENNLTLKLSPNKDIYATIANDEVDSDFQLRTVPMKVKLPVNVGDELGHVDVLRQGNLVQSVPLVALNALPQNSPVTKTQYIKYFVSSGVLMLSLIAFSRVRRRVRRRMVYRG